MAWAPPPVAVGPRRAAPNPTAGREAQTRGLFSFVVVLTAFFIGLNAVNGLLPSVVPPGLALFSLLGLLVVLDGLSRIVLPARYWYWRFPTAVLVVAVVAWANRSVDKLQFENMAYDPWSRTDLRERVAREYLPGPGPRTGVGAERDGLVDEREARQAWRGQAPATGGRKPKLVVVCCSGGGARPLVWTATVLDRLGQAVPGFDDSVRVIAAGSAGGPGPGTTSRRGTTGCRSHGPPACRPASGSSRPDGRRQSPATASRQSYGRSRWPRSGGCSTRGRCAGPPPTTGAGSWSASGSSSASSRWRSSARPNGRGWSRR